MAASIDATGHADVTRQLQAFVARVPNGRVIRFRASGRYRLDGTLLIDGRHDLTFDGAGATVFAVARGGSNRAQFRVHDGSAITFRNLKVQGASPNAGTAKGAYIPKLAKQHGIRFEGVNGAEVDRVTVSDVYGDFVYVGLDEHEVASRNVWIHDSTFHNNGRQGIAVTAAAGVIIERNSFADTRRSTIDLEPTGHRWRVDHVFVLNNVVGRGRLLFVASGGQGPVDDVVVSGNRLPAHGLTIDVKASGQRRRSNWVVTDNISAMPVTSRALRFAAVDGLLVRGNRQSVTGKDPGLILTDVCGAVVDGNQFGAGTGAGTVRRTGTPCAARLVVPQPPVIPGRSAAANPRIGSPAPSNAPIWQWVAAAIGLCVILSVVLVVVVRRRRRRHAREPDANTDANADAAV